MRWLVLDTLYCSEALPFGHLDASCHYLAQMGFDVSAWDLRAGPPPKTVIDNLDVIFAMDRFDVCSRIWAKVAVAQVAAIVDPMPWNVRKADGSPAYDLIVSSILWMVEAAREAGCRAEYLPLCFDTRALICGMGVNERDIPLLFCGTRDGNHQKRESWIAQLGAELGDRMTIAPPTFGHAFFALLARAKNLLVVQAEWSRGIKNAMALYEGSGLGCRVLTDCEDPSMLSLPGDTVESPADVREIMKLDTGGVYDREREAGQARTLTRHTYVQRIPVLVDLVRSVIG